MDALPELRQEVTPIRTHPHFVGIASVSCSLQLHIAPLQCHHVCRPLKNRSQVEWETLILGNTVSTPPEA